MNVKDTYKTILENSAETLYKDKNSKFFGYAFPVSTETDVKKNIALLKKQHHSARHWCYAYQLGTETIKYRVNDDGEPSNSAGMPIYGQIQSHELTNILIVVVRYFGGVKLGVGGLINAYRTSAQYALEASKIVTRTINIVYLITFDYKHMNKVMRIIKQHQITILNQKLELDCQIKISIRKKEAKKIKLFFESIYEVSIKMV